MYLQVCGSSLDNYLEQNIVKKRLSGGIMYNAIGIGLCRFIECIIRQNNQP